MKKNNLQKWIAIFFLVLLVNTAYVAAFSSATVFYMTNVLFHLGWASCCRWQSSLRSIKGRT